MAVKASLDRLATQCRRSSVTTTEERTGGWMLAGPEGRIKVSLLGPDDGPSPSLEANSTSLEANSTFLEANSSPLEVNPLDANSTSSE